MHVRLLALCCLVPIALGARAQTDRPATMADVLATSEITDWRTPNDDYVLYLELPKGRVVIELAPQFAPKHVRNILQLVRQEYFDGLAIVRAQDNYVAQWGDPHAADPKKARQLGEARGKLAAEFARDGADLSFMPLPAQDAYAEQVGFVSGFPAARDGSSGQTWLAHCYGMVGAGRDVAIGSGSGAELYAVIGHAPRHLDRNVTLVGRVLMGIELLSTLPRGTGEFGFYATRKERTKIRSMRIAADVPEKKRTRLEVFRTDRPAFYRLVDARANRREEWFADPIGRIELCNVPIPVRLAESSSTD